MPWAVARVELRTWNGRGAPEVQDIDFFRERHPSRAEAEAEAVQRLVKARDLPSGVSFVPMELPELTEAEARTRKAVMATFTAHVGPVPALVRRAFVGLLIGKGRPVGQMKLWVGRKWEALRPLMARHCESCPGGEECELLTRAREMLEG